METEQNIIGYDLDKFRMIAQAWKEISRYETEENRIFFMEEYLNLRHDGMDYEEAVRHAHRAVAMANQIWRVKR